MDADKVLDTLFPVTPILKGIFGLLGNVTQTAQTAVASVPQIAQSVTAMVPATVNQAGQAVSRTVQSVAPGGIPGLVQSAAQFPGQVLSPLFGGGQQPQPGVPAGVDAYGNVFDAYGNFLGQQQPQYGYSGYPQYGGYGYGGY